MPCKADPAKPAVLTATNLDGAVCQLPPSNATATVLYFVIHDCPICNRYSPELNRIVQDYSGRKVAVYIVYAESDFSAAQAKKHAKDYGYTCGLLRDPGHALSRAVGATVASEVVILGPDASIDYRGPIDNKYIHFGQTRPQPTARYLRDALDQILAGAPVATPSEPVVGCAIPID